MLARNDFKNMFVNMPYPSITLHQLVAGKISSPGGLTDRVLLALKTGRAQRSWRWSSLSKAVSHRQVIGILLRHALPRKNFEQIQVLCKSTPPACLVSHSFTRDVRGLMAACFSDLFERGF